ncbi:MAG: aminotransferase class V-fold PLP-dependent enzyme, partial [Nitrospinae bacterium]|nr:aminotransferase class V-fold PLP-dependent enzyme [Nitrospinota bacterium]
KTKVIAISHVQFTSGFKTDLQKLGLFCKEHNIDLIVDAAQSLGCLPLYPEEWNVSAVVSSGWKWLMGPIGTGILYTSPQLREKLNITMAGADMMKQGQDYLNHTWQPLHCGGLFEYSTVSISLLAGLDVCIREISLKYGIENVFKENQRLQKLFLDGLNNKDIRPVIFSEENRSGILALDCKKDPNMMMKELYKKGIICTSRGNYLRFAPHIYNSDEEVCRLLAFLNTYK